MCYLLFKKLSLICIVSFLSLNTARGAVKDSIHIHLQFAGESLKTDDSLVLTYGHTDYIAGDRNSLHIKQAINNGSASFHLATNEAISFNFSIRSIPGFYYLDAGDSVSIDISDNGIVSKGRGSEKINLMISTLRALEHLPPPATAEFEKLNFLEDYFSWNRYLHAKNNIILTKADQYKGRINEPALTFMKTYLFMNVENARLHKFRFLLEQAKELGLHFQDTQNIYDSTVANTIYNWINQQDISASNMSYYQNMAIVLFTLDKTIPINNEKDELKRLHAYHDVGLRMLKGKALKSYLTYIITQKGIRKGLFKEAFPFIQEVTGGDKNSPYAIYIRQYIKRKRIEAMILGYKTADFAIAGSNGEKDSAGLFNGYSTLLTIWPENTTKSSAAVDGLDKFYRDFPVHANFKQVNLLSYKDVATLKEMRSKYPHQHWYTSLPFADSSMYTDFGVEDEPMSYLINATGNFVEYLLPSDSVHYWGASIRDKIKKQLAYTYDGPYVINDVNKKIVYQLNGSEISKLTLSGSDSLGALNVQSDNLDEKFQVQLKSHYEPEPSVFEQPDKIFVLSDIEGNLTALRALLTRNGIIDDQFNWTFGTGHLILIGDMVDRGNQVTECLWLIYAMEEKAKSAGGYVHFILGNHEIMNLQGDLRYVKEKYKINAKRMGLTHEQLFAANSELGAWIRTKNIMEKVGDVLFVHGGISPELVSLPLSISEINERMRSYYPFLSNMVESAGMDTTGRSVLNSNTNSPYWYRGYYLSGKKRTPMKIIDDSLKKYNVNKIITGHCLAGKIDLYYDGKVINTDTHHAKGVSEALLIERDAYYRVNSIGRKLPLRLSEYAATVGE